MKQATHKDMQGKTLKVGDRVAYVSYRNGNSLVIGKVRDLKKVRAEVITKNTGGWNAWLGGDTIETIRSDQLIKLSAAKAQQPKSAKVLAFAR